MRSRPALRGAWPAVVATVVGTASFLLPSTAPAQPDDSDDSSAVGSGLDADLATLLDRALSPAAIDLAATLAVIAFDEVGPTVSEYAVRAEAGGDLVATTSGRWSFARTGDDAFAQIGGGPALRLGAVADRATTAESLLANYEVVAGEPLLLDTGRAVPLELTSRATGVLRERLWVDQALQTLVRRETYGMDGTPRRLLALTAVDVIAPRSARTMPTDATAQGDLIDLTTEATQILGRTGWVTPTDLPQGWRLHDAFAMGDGETSALHLVYTDGLYSMSVYEQRGDLDVGGLAGAVHDGHDGMTLFRWPGAEPERLAWTDGSMTYTVVTDAPHDVIVPVIAGLPHEKPASITQRLGRGLGRVVSWFNPFG